VGLVQYLACANRPDIAAACGTLGALVRETINLPFAAVFRYLRKPRSLLFRSPTAPTAGEKTAISVETHSDADLGGSRSGKSRGGYSVFVAGCLVAWRSHTITSVCTNTTESETIAAATAAAATVDTATLVEELHREFAPLSAATTLTRRWVVNSRFDEKAVENGISEFDDPRALSIPSLYVDNESLLHIVCGARPAARARHLRLKAAYLRQLHNDRAVSLRYVESGQNVADCLTKALAPAPHGAACEKLGIIAGRAEAPPTAA
jgi:hypothetical protein